MGAQLVSRVFVSWSHLPDRPFRLLVHMAHIIKDASKQPTYYGGREMMAHALGLEPESPSAHQAVKLTVRKLVDAGAIERALYGHAGKRSEYRLTLERGNDSNPLRGNGSDPQRGNARDPHRGNDSLPEGVTNQTPLGTNLGRTEENKEEGKSPRKVTLPSERVQGRKASDSRLKSVREQADREAS